MEGVYVKDNVIYTKPMDYYIHPKGLGYMIFESMKKYKDKIAQVDLEAKTFDTYGEFLERCINIAIELRNRGYCEKDMIGVCSFNNMNSNAVYVASQFIGCPLACFDPTLPLKDMVHLMKQVKPKIMFASENAVDLLEETAIEIKTKQEIITFEKHSYYDSIDVFIKFKDESKSFKPLVIEDLKKTVMILFSSGTTGLPKGICLNGYALMAQAQLTNDYNWKGNSEFPVNLNGREVTLTNPTLYFSSLYWVSSVLFLNCCLFNGYSRGVAKPCNAKTALKYIKEYKIAVTFFSPPFAMDILKEKPLEYNLTSLERVLIGGCAISKTQMLEVRKALPHSIVAQGSGMTELSSAMLEFNIHDKKQLDIVERTPDSMGRPMAGFTYKVVDTETEENLGPYKNGELRVKTDLQMNGYYNVDSSNCWDSEGFLKTGDLVYYDEDLCFYHVDRIKELLKFRSFHISPQSLESLLCSHPAVLQSVVVGVPHFEDGDHPCAFVVKRSNYATSEKELMDYVERNVDDRQRLRGGLYFIDELPITPSGKVKRNDLKKMALMLKQ